MQITRFRRKVKQLDINLLLVGLKTIGLFLLSNITAILFLSGLAFIVYAVFLVSTIFGFVAIGVALILIALIVNTEQQQANKER